MIYRSIRYCLTSSWPRSEGLKGSRQSGSQLVHTRQIPRYRLAGASCELTASKVWYWVLRTCIIHGHAQAFSMVLLTCCAALRCIAHRAAVAYSNACTHTPVSPAECFLPLPLRPAKPYAPRGLYEAAGIYTICSSGPPARCCCSSGVHQPHPLPKALSSPFPALRTHTFSLHSLHSAPHQVTRMPKVQAGRQTNNQDADRMSSVSGLQPSKGYEPHLFAPLRFHPSAPLPLHPCAHGRFAPKLGRCGHTNPF